MSKLKKTFQDMVDTLKNAAIDLSSLEVTTYTGEIQHYINEEGKFDMKKVGAMLKKDVAVSGEASTTAHLNVVAHTHSDFDQDCILFVKENLTPEERELFELHISMFGAARASRLAFLAMLTEILD